jgi:hypothetical protein
MASQKHSEDEILARFASGDLNDASAEKVRAHVKECVDCRRRLARFSTESPVSRPTAAKSGTRVVRNSIKRSAWPAATLGAVLGLMGLTGWVATTLDGRAAETSPSTAQKEDISTPPATVAGTTTQSSAVALMTDTAPNLATAVDVPKSQVSGPLATLEKPATPNDGLASSSRVAGVVVKEPVTGHRDDGDGKRGVDPSSEPAVAVAKTNETAAAVSSRAFFNAKDLNGWDGPSECWRVADKAIVGTPRANDRAVVFLFSKKTYRDFDLKFRVLLPEGISAGGIQFRSQVKDSAQLAVVGPRCVIGGKTGDDEHPVGSLVSDLASKLDVRPKSILATKYIKPGMNHFHIRCEGKVVLIKVNGATMVRGKYDSIPDEGVIAFRLDGNQPAREIRIKDIRFTDLSAAPALAANPGGGLSDPAIVKAEMNYAGGVEKANRNLDKQFETQIAKFRSKQHGDDKPAEIAILESERKDFGEKGLIPWSEQMRAWTFDYLKKISKAQDRLEQVFKTAIEGARKKHDDKRLAALQEEQESVLAPHIVAIAEMVGPDGETQKDSRIEFRSDGLFSRTNDDHPDYVRCWSLEGGNLVLEHPKPDESDQAVIHQCVLTRDGKSWTTTDAEGNEQSWRFVME